jgi:hypothetical protein
LAALLNRTKYSFFQTHFNSSLYHPHIVAFNAGGRMMGRSMHHTVFRQLHRLLRGPERMR